MYDRGLLYSSGFGFNPLLLPPLLPPRPRPPPPPLLSDAADGRRDTGGRGAALLRVEPTAVEEAAGREANLRAGVRLTTDEGEKGEGATGGSRDSDTDKPRGAEGAAAEDESGPAAAEAVR